MVVNYYDKYVKYKNKYLALQIQKGGVHSAIQEIQMYKDTVSTVRGAFATTTYTSATKTYTSNTKDVTNKLLDIVKLACVNMLKICIKKGYRDRLFTRCDQYRCEMDNGKCKMYTSGSVLLNEAEFKSLTADTCEAFVTKTFTNIRSSFTFLDQCIKTFSDYYCCIKQIMDKFDNEVRFRTKRDATDLESKTFYFDTDATLQQQDSKVPAYARTDLAIKLHVLPGAVIPKLSDDDFLYVTPEYLIEAYSSPEILAYPDAPKIIGAGANIFKEPHTEALPAAGSIGAFVAGISGHSMDMMLLFSLFFTQMNSSNENQLDFKLQYYVISACLVWMTPYYHHSFREIVALLNVYCPGNVAEAEIYDLFESDKNILSVMNKYKDDLLTIVNAKRESATPAKPKLIEIIKSEINTSDLHSVIIKRITNKLVAEVLKDEDVKTIMTSTFNNLYTEDTTFNSKISAKIADINTRINLFRKTNLIDMPRQYLHLPAVITPGTIVSCVHHEFGVSC